MKQTQGIVLSMTPLKEKSAIISLFTEIGVMKFFTKERTNPLAYIEVSYRTRQGEVHSCFQQHTLNHFLYLRDSLSKLEAACEMLDAIRRSQLPEKPAPKLFKLLIKYLELLSDHCPTTLVASFKLKTLKHEGLLAPEEASPLSECRMASDLVTIKLADKEAIDLLFRAKYAY